ncbi:hypothetical protein [Halobacteriovorax sp. YZS-1-1]|uniref:hypothetical protein n=1 Tax=unclassified Halobacteriovorax TaxID=2639665 RepID=UPI00399B03CB
MKLILTFFLILVSFTFASSPTDSFNVTKIDWLEIKMNLFAIERNFTFKSNVDCSKDKDNRTIYCIDGDTKSTGTTDKALAEMFRRHFIRIAKDLKIEKSVELKLSFEKKQIN